MVLAAWLSVGCVAARAADALVGDLEQRLAQSGADAVNTHLVAQWSQAMVPLNQKTAACELPTESASAAASRLMTTVTLFARCLTFRLRCRAALRQRDCSPAAVRPAMSAR